MKTILKKIYTILVLIKNVIFRKKNYTLHFVAETSYPFTRHLDAPHLDAPTVKRWYYDFKHWGFAHDNLEMVAGADSICNAYAKGKNEVTVNIIATKKQILDINLDEYDEYVVGEVDDTLSTWEKIIMGRTYTNIMMMGEKTTYLRTMWICPVTLFVLGRYPNYIYIKK